MTGRTLSPVTPPPLLEEAICLMCLSMPRVGNLTAQAGRDVLEYSLLAPNHRGRALPLLSEA